MFAELALLTAPVRSSKMGACCSCFCCPICTACGTACSVPCATCCDYGGLAWLERDSTLALSLASLLLGLCLHLVMTVKCAALHDTSWSPLPTHYENGPCFSSGGDNAYANHGFFGAVFMGVGFPFAACCLYARATKERHREQRRMLGLAEPVTYWWGFTHSFKRVYYTMPMAPVVPGGLAMGGAGSALYPHAPFGGASPSSQRHPEEVPVAAVVVDPEPAVDDRATAPPIESMDASGASRTPHTHTGSDA